jgi:hypothetical protein
MFRLVVAGPLNRSDIFALALCLCLLPVMRSGLLLKKKSMKTVLGYFFGDQQGSVGEQVRPRLQENHQPCSLAGVAGVASRDCPIKHPCTPGNSVVNPAMTKIDEETQPS